MTFYVKLVWKIEDRKIFTRIRQCKGNWSTAHAAVVSLRDRLLTLQNNRCAYCQAGIEADENGYREIEHILPKSNSHACTAKSGTCNLYSSRRNTLGYAEFCFEPRNLVLTCKQCNTRKGSFDPLRDRSCARPLKKFPSPSKVEWFNPHFHKYTDHIVLNRNFIFSAASPEGGSVIKECGLDDPEVLEKKFQFRARSRASHSHNLENAIRYLSASVAAFEFSRDHALTAMQIEFGVNRADAELLFDLCRESFSTTEYEKLKNALASVERRIQRYGKSARAAAASIMRI